jgi:hypothetical protein
MYCCMIVLVTLVYRKGILNEADPFSRRLDFVYQATVSLFWDGEDPSDTFFTTEVPTVV